MRFRGSRLHVLDWVDGAGGSFQMSLNGLLKGIGFSVVEGFRTLPLGTSDPREARLGKDFGGPLTPDQNRMLREWWLVRQRGVNVPNWDLACHASILDLGTNSSGLVPIEAEADVAEFTKGEGGKPPGNGENDTRITRAIGEAQDALRSDGWDIKISRDRWYQLSNRIAFAWKLASMGVPTVLIYLGFTGDEGIRDVGEPIQDEKHWRSLVMERPGRSAANYVGHRNTRRRNTPSPPDPVNTLHQALAVQKGSAETRQFWSSRLAGSIGPLISCLPHTKPPKVLDERLLRVFPALKIQWWLQRLYEVCLHCLNILIDRHVRTTQVAPHSFGQSRFSILVKPEVLGTGGRPSRGPSLHLQIKSLFEDSTKGPAKRREATMRVIEVASGIQAACRRSHVEETTGTDPDFRKGLMIQEEVGIDPRSVCLGKLIPMVLLIEPAHFCSHRYYSRHSL